MWNQILTYVYYSLIRPMYKWLLRYITGRCELLRITYKEVHCATCTYAIENSLKHSKTPGFKGLLTDENVHVKNAVENIMKIKEIIPEVHPRFEPVLTVCLCQICGYRQLISEVETLRKTHYCAENLEHERLLLQLWDYLKPDSPLLSRISKQWQEIGFQGDDPKTDFRGMGILGLRNLLFFVSHYVETAHQLLSHSHHPQYGYSFAIVGINITSLAHQLLTSGALKTHFYNIVQGRPNMDHFHHVYCYLFHEFDKFWFAEKPRDIMEFNRVRNKFHKQIVGDLKDKTAILQGNLTVHAH